MPDSVLKSAPGENELEKVSKDSEEGVWRTHASDDVEELGSIGLGETTGGVHLVDVERDGAGAEFLDEKMGKKVVVVGEIVHVHYLRRPPFQPAVAPRHRKNETLFPPFI